VCVYMEGIFSPAGVCSLLSAAISLVEPLSAQHIRRLTINRRCRC